MMKESIFEYAYFSFLKFSVVLQVIYFLFCIVFLILQQLLTKTFILQHTHSVEQDCQTHFPQGSTFPLGIQHAGADDHDKLLLPKLKGIKSVKKCQDFLKSQFLSNLFSTFILIHRVKERHSGTFSKFPEDYNISMSLQMPPSVIRSASILENVSTPIFLHFRHDLIRNQCISSYPIKN